MPISRLDHYSIRTLKLDETRRFYVDVLGFEDGPRPPFKFPGAWLYNGDRAIIHIIGIDPNDKQGLVEYLGDRDMSALEGTGALDHVAFYATGLAEMCERFRKEGYAYRERTVPDLGLHQLFLEDPNGVTIELNFASSELPESRT